MPYPQKAFTQKLASTEINGKEYSTYLFSVTGSREFLGTCKKMFLDNLEAVGNVDVGSFLGGNQSDKITEAGAKEALGFFQSISKAVKATDYDDFFDWHLKCIESCIDISNKTETSNVNPDNLDLPWNFAMFGWFLAVQLGPFTHLLPDWLTQIIAILKKMGKEEIMEAITDFIQTSTEDEAKSLEQQHQTSQD